MARDRGKVRQATKYLKMGKSVEWLVLRGFKNDEINQARHDFEKSAPNKRSAIYRCKECGSLIHRNSSNSCLACVTRDWIKRGCNENQ